MTRLDSLQRLFERYQDAETPGPALVRASAFIDEARKLLPLLREWEAARSHSHAVYDRAHELARQGDADEINKASDRATAAYEALAVWLRGESP